MSYQTTNPHGAKDLLGGAEEWIYLDVRTVEEYEAGHVPGAYNIPFAFRTAAGMEINPSFVAAVQRRFPPGTSLVLGCAAGGRSARACDLLVPEGYGSLVNMHGGFSGAFGPSGDVQEPGWQACGFPTTTEGDPERAWSALQG